MQVRSYKNMHEYIFGDFANIEKSLEKKPAHTHETSRAKKVKEITDFFSKLDFRFRFQTALRHLKSHHLESVLFGNVTDTLDAKVDLYPIPDDKAIESQFREFERQHAFFSPEDSQQALERFIRFFHLAKLIADFIEKNNSDYNDAAYTHAYKMLVLFGNETSIKKSLQLLDTYLANNNFHDKSTPLHDALIWGLPKNNSQKPPLHLTQWRKIIQKTGPKALRIFSKAFEIEAKLGGKAPKDFQEAFEVGKLITYKKVNEDPELAELCMLYNISEDIFNRCLKIKKNRKTSDALPQVSVDGKEVGKPGYHLVKLPIQDPRAFLLGHITDCCQSIGGHSEECVIDGITRVNNGFYVLLKEKRKTPEYEAKEPAHPAPLYLNKDGTLQIDYAHFDIVGQGYAWLSCFGNLVFDSWENLRPAKLDQPGDDAIIIPMLQAFGKKVVEQKDSTIFRVCIGRGGKTPAGFENIVIKEIMREGLQYDDSANHQGLIYCNKEEREELFQKLLQAISQSKALKFDPNKLLGYDIIISRNLVSLIQLLIKRNEVDQWLCFNAEFYELITTNSLIWAALALLNQANIYHPKTIQNIMKTAGLRKYENEDFFNSFIKLNQSGLLKDYFEHFIKIEHNSRFWDASARGIVTLKKHGLFNNAYEELIFQAGASGEHVSNALVKLRAANLLNDTNVKTITPALSMTGYFADTVIALSTNQEPAEYDYEDALQEAIVNKNIPLVKLLIESKRIDFKNPKLISGEGTKWGGGPLHNATLHGNLELVKLIAQTGIPIDSKSYHAGATPLNCAAMSNRTSVEMAKFLLEEKADINSSTRLTGITPLLQSLFCGNHSLTAYFLEHKDIFIDTKRLFDFGKFRQVHSKISKSIAILYETKLLNKTNFAALITGETADIIRKNDLLSFLYDNNNVNEVMLILVNSLCTLDIDCFKKFLELILINNIPLQKIRLELLRDKISELLFYQEILTRLNNKNILTSETINFILQSGKDEALRMLAIFIEIFDKKHSPEKLCHRILQDACQLSKKPELELFLLKHIAINNVAYINTVNLYGNTLLFDALKNQHEALARFLLSHKEIKIQDKPTMAVTPLLLAIKHGYTSLIPIIIQKMDTTNFNRENQYGITPLLQAVMYKQYDIVAILLEMPATYINAQNCIGYTPLHAAAAAGDIKMIHLLLKLGADPSLKNKSGLTPAELTKNTAIKTLLKSKLDHSEFKNEYSL